MNDRSPSRESGAESSRPDTFCAVGAEGPICPTTRPTAMEALVRQHQRQNPNHKSCVDEGLSRAPTAKQASGLRPCSSQRSRWAGGVVQKKVDSTRPSREVRLRPRSTSRIRAIGPTTKTNPTAIYTYTFSPVRWTCCDSMSRMGMLAWSRSGVGAWLAS
jgi:hypothetical protein